MVFFNLKSMALYGLLAVATATPIFNVPQDEPSTHLEARMTKKKSVSQNYQAINEQVIEAKDIRKALNEARQLKANHKTNGKYPAPFANKAKNNGLAIPIFKGRPMGKDSGLMEYPLRLPGERLPGSVRVVMTNGATPNVVGLMQHPPGLDSSFRKLNVAGEKKDAACTTGGESSKDGAKKNTARSLWDLVKRKVTGKKGAPAQGAACAYKPGRKAKGKTPATTTKGKTGRGKKKAGAAHGKKKAGKGRKTKPVRKAHKKRPARKRPARKHARPTRKGGRRGGKRGGRV